MRFILPRAIIDMRGVASYCHTAELPVVWRVALTISIGEEMIETRTGKGRIEQRRERSTANSAREWGQYLLYESGDLGDAFRCGIGPCPRDERSALSL